MRACSQPRNAPAGARARRLREFTMIWSAHVVQTHKCPHGTKMAQPSDADCPCRHTTHSFSRGSGGAACAMLVVTGRASSSDGCIRECVCFWTERACARELGERGRERGRKGKRECECECKRRGEGEERSGGRGGRDVCELGFEHLQLSLQVFFVCVLVCVCVFVCVRKRVNLHTIVA